MDISELLRQTHLFDALSDEQFAELLGRAREVKVDQGELFIRAGESADSLYVIREGVCKVFNEDAAGKQIVLSRLIEGAYLGEQALLAPGGRRTASARALCDMVLIELPGGDFRELLQRDDQLKARLEQVGTVQVLREIRDAQSKLQVSDELFAGDTETRHYAEGDLIIRQGDDPEGVHLISSGQVNILMWDDADRKILVATLTEGNIVGEYGVLRNEPTTASVEAAGDVTTRFIPADKFKELHAENEQLQAITRDLQQLYLTRRGRMTQYFSKVLEMDVMTSQIQLRDGRQLWASQVAGEPIACIHEVTTIAPRPVRYQADKGILRELYLIDNRLVGVNVYGEWPGLDAVFELVFEATVLTADQLVRFAAEGELFEGKKVAVPVLEDADTVICKCVCVRKGDISELIQQGATEFNEVKKACGAGSICGSCIPGIKAMFGKASWQAVHVSNVEQLTPDIRAYSLVPEAGKSLKSALAGQHIVIQAEIGGNWVERPYTLTSVSGQGDCYEVAIRHLEGGLLSSWIFGKEPENIQLRASAPQGKLAIALSKRLPLVCFVAGVGVTPAVAFARSIVAAGAQRPLVIHCSAHAREDFAYGEELKRIARDVPHIEFIPRITSEVGRIEAHEAAELVNRYPDAAYFICGPEAYEKALKEALLDAGVPQNKITVETFVHATAS